MHKNRQIKHSKIGFAQRQRRAALLAIIVATASMLIPEPRQIQRRWWVRPLLQDRAKKAGLKMLKEEFKEDPDQFKQFLRLDQKTFDKLLNLIKPFIQKKDTNYRKAISAQDKLVVTLRFLATGETYRSLMYTFRIHESTISLFVPQVCQAIYSALKNEYLKTPQTSADWLNVAKEFETRWNIPNVLGALDGKHIVFGAPKNKGSLYFNYKGSHSIVLLALVHAKYNFIYIDVGVNGRVSDGGVFRSSSLSKAINQNTIGIPENKPLPGRQKAVPFVILADAAFPLSEHILKPYPFRNMTGEQRIFNYRLSRGRRVVENTFGHLANRFRVFLTTINLGPEKVQSITLACCALHNFLKRENPKHYEEEIDKDFVFKFGLTKQSGNRPKQFSLDTREEFKNYFINEGSVHWQYDNM